MTAQRSTTGAVVVTGAFGQIGKRCTEILLRRGHTVVATDLHTNKAVAAADKLAAGGYPGKLVVAYADVLDADAIRQLVLTHRPRALVHLAAMCSPPSYRNPRLARQVNVGGTRNLVKAAQALPDPPLVVMASSAAVYGSRNPHRFPERITSATAVNPIDQYGEDKVLAETVIRDSGLPHAVLRLGGVISPDAARNLSRDYLVLMRATPGDNRLHTVDARDAALAFANAVDHAQAVNTTVLLIAGDDTHVHTHREVEDDMLAALGWAGSVRRPACPAIPATTADGASPAGSTPPKHRGCCNFSSMIGPPRSRGSPSPTHGYDLCCAPPAR